MRARWPSLFALAAALFHTPEAGSEEHAEAAVRAAGYWLSGSVIEEMNGMYARVPGSDARVVPQNRLDRLVCEVARGDERWRCAHRYSSSQSIFIRVRQLAGGCASAGASSPLMSSNVSDHGAASHAGLSRSPSMRRGSVVGSRRAW